ncbi:Ubiquitin carboxyl-terminal hydrolase ubh-4 [Curvularia clavata]|uniref:Ubiquitin carboxyl-terminal hydrolase n=1 Tax=Curvularia clavata TaxID=95742 RepID=A0A9Q9DNJ6_CURCL|nr:Ubiquitin carboxyl-terminal hydrolase ubh-4 [Curvularia clavata]
MAQAQYQQSETGVEALETPKQNDPERPMFSNGPDLADIAGSDATKEETAMSVPGVCADSEPSATPSEAASPNNRKRGLPEPSPDTKPSVKRSKGSPSPAPLESNVKSRPAFPSPPGMPATRLDKETWQGFCEIESEPACFSVILREMGVQGVTVREVFSMDQDFIRENIPQPIYGFILLFHYRQFGNQGQENENSNKVWMANQLPAQNSCATLAMINVLMNQSTDVSIGEHLQQFKDFTKDFTPYQRGEAFSSFQFVKRIHNSFAKKMDILEGDKHLSHKVKRAKRAKAQLIENIKPKTKKKGTKPRRISVDSAATDDSQESVENNAHHYIAFIPVGNEVWKLDGLDKYPTRVGSFDQERGETWLESVSETITALMAVGDDDYGVIALTQSPLVSLRKRISLTINTTVYAESRLDNLSASWRDLVDSGEQLPSPRMLGVEEQLTVTPLSDALKEAIDKEGTEELLSRRQLLIIQASYEGAQIMTEMQSEADEDEKATQRRYDSGPVIKKWLEMLAENGFLEENLERFMPCKAKRK